MGRGPAAGGPREGSLKFLLLGLQVGECLYFESSLEKYSMKMRTIHADASRIGVDMKFSCRLYTAVGAGEVGDIVYLVRVQRTA
jgi:hypothetical protein